MRRKTFVLLTSYLCAALIAFGGMAAKDYIGIVNYERIINNSNQRSFNELVTSIHDIDTSLSKVKYATTYPMVNSLCTQIFGKAMAAQMALGELPFSNYELTETSAFFTRVGNYAYALSVIAAGGKMPLENDMQNLQSLSLTAAALSSRLTTLEADIGHGTITIGELKKAQRQTDKTEEQTSPSSLGDNFKLIESEFPEVPMLVYDGPFSAHLEGQKPKLIENADEIDEETARNKAIQFMNVSPDKAYVSGTRGGRVPAYLIKTATARGDVTVVVTKQGGAILSVVDGFAVNKAEISPEGAVDIAKNFLNDHGYPNMRSSYWIVENNTALINFAYVQDNVICYPDLIKVSVALDTGSIIGFEANGYITNHYDRDFPEVIISEGEAKRYVSPSLLIMSHELALIPTNGKFEVLCHEFKCLSPEGRHYLIYVNARTGHEEQMLILIEDPGGTLTI